MLVFVAKVKNVVSADTVVLVPSKTTQFPPPERVFTLSYVRSNDSFECKEFVRTLLIGKEIKFKVLSKHPHGKEFGDIKSPIFNSLIEYLLERGIVKLKDNIKEESDFIDNIHVLEDKARTESKGLWDTNSPGVETIPLNETIINKSSKSPVTTIVERVISGDRVMARIIVNKSEHVVTPLLLAGIRCPRTDDAGQSKLSLSVANQAKAFVEEKLLTTKVNLKINIVGENQAGIPVAIFHHPSGNNIHEKLLENGFGEVVDWQSTLIASDMMKTFRRAEQSARALGKGLYATGTTSSSATNEPAVSVPNSKVSSKTLRPGITVENVVVARVLSADTYVVKLPSDEEITVQLASIRAPKPNDTTVTPNSQHQLALVNSSRECARQLAAGKTCSMYIDGFRKENKDMGFDSRFMVSIKIAGNVDDLSESIIKKGWASVIRHNKQTLDERSLNWDRLIELEENQKKSGRNGIFFKGDITKVFTVGVRIVDASENAARAKSFINGFKQKGRISGGYHVEFIPSFNRVKLFNPKEGMKLTLILGGLANVKSEFSESGLKYMNSKFLQKNVEFDIYDMDKIGGFIGNLYLNSNAIKPVQINLLQQGFAKIHDLAVDVNPFADDLLKAEESAKSQKIGLWINEKPEDVNAITAAVQDVQIEQKPQFFDVEITYIDGEEEIIYFQKLDSTTQENLKLFKDEFDEFHKQIPSASKDSIDLPYNLVKSPKKGDFVSVMLEDNGKYYRGKVLSHDRVTNTFEVKHLDYGNIDNVELLALRSLPSQFSINTIPVLCQSFKLLDLVLPPTNPVDYLTEALELLDVLTLDKQLVISALPSKTPGVDFDAVLFDSQQSIKDPHYTINKKLVSEGFALVNSKAKPNDYVNELKKLQLTAMENHKGCWKYGKVAFDEEE